MPVHLFCIQWVLDLGINWGITITDAKECTGKGDRIHTLRWVAWIDKLLPYGQCLVCKTNHCSSQSHGGSISIYYTWAAAVIAQTWCISCNSDGWLTAARGTGVGRDQIRKYSQECVGQDTMACLWPLTVMIPPDTYYHNEKLIQFTIKPQQSTYDTHSVNAVSMAIYSWKGLCFFFFYWLCNSHLYQTSQGTGLGATTDPRRDFGCPGSDKKKKRFFPVHLVPPQSLRDSGAAQVFQDLVPVTHARTNPWHKRPAWWQQGWRLTLLYPINKSIVLAA